MLMLPVASGRIGHMVRVGLPARPKDAKRGSAACAVRTEQRRCALLSAGYFEGLQAKFMAFTQQAIM